MRKTRKGSNQFKTKYARSKIHPVIYLALILLLGEVIVFHAYEEYSLHNVTSPLADRVYAYEIKPTPTPTPNPTLENIVAYIALKFKPEGKQVVVKAIECFYSESGLRHDAYNYNTNRTEDKGVAQINSIWKLDDPYNYQKNIDKAYQIYKRSNSFQAWYGKGCN